MSGLAHYLEDEGIATTLVALVRLHAETVQPPRALWVPFELGRPLGEPGDKAGHKRVLSEALALLDRTDGPVIIEDFETGNEGGLPDEAWASPIAPAPGFTPKTLIAALKEEMTRIKPIYVEAKAATGRTTLGVSGIEVDDIPELLAAFIAGADVTSPVEGVSATVVLRFAVDDLKTLYLEAATAGVTNPSSTQLTTWFWHETVASQTIAALRTVLLASNDRGKKMVGGGFIMPPIVAAALNL